jgi:GntR family transcriptional regulator
MSTASKRRTPRPFALDVRSGVPIYRQIMDQVVGAIATGALAVGDQLPTVRQLAVDLAINPNTVIRAYRELELQGALETQQGTGTFISHQKTNLNGGERQRRLTQLTGEFAARAGSEGITVEELIRQLQELQKDAGKRRG